MNLTKRVPIRTSLDWSVWRGEQRGTRRLYLVKEANSASTGQLQLAARLRDEYQFLSVLEHPHIVKPLWIDRAGTQAAFTDAQCSLAQYVAAHGPLTPTLVANVLAQAADALDYLHARRLGHGCVNANTLLVGPSGDVKFGDFLGYEFGTSSPLPVPDPEPHYQAPELIDAALGRPGPTSDLYCLGFLALELLAGDKFEGLFGVPDAANWLAWHADPYKQLADWQPVLSHAPAGLLDTVAGLIAKRPAERAFPTAAQFKGALSRFRLTSDQRLPPYQPPGVDVPTGKVIEVRRPPQRTRTGTLPARPSMKPVLVLHPLTEPGKPKTFAASMPVLLGQGRDALVHCGGAGVARKHALLTCGVEGVWRVFDLRSLGGTWVNGTPVDRAKLYPDDELYLGECGFRVGLEYRRGGRTLDEFRLVAELHAGARGRVYRALWPKKDGREVAVRVFPRTFQHEAESLRRLLRGTSGLAGLHHPNLVRTFRLGARRVGTDRVWFVATEYLAAGSLRDWLRARGRLPVATALRMGRHAAQAAGAMAQAGWVHRNINPGCVLFASDGRAKLGDFFFARQLDGGEAGGELEESADLAYRAPECLDGRASTPAADAYSLGAILYEALTGKPPFDPAGSPAEVARRVLDEPLREPRDVSARVPATVNELVCRGLAKDPKRRFDSPAALGAALAAVESGLGSLDCCDKSVPAIA
jgi:serine/threonine protein kinase